MEGVEVRVRREKAKRRQVTGPELVMIDLRLG